MQSSGPGQSSCLASDVLLLGAGGEQVFERANLARLVDSRAPVNKGIRALDRHLPFGST